MFGRIAAGLVHDLSHPIQNIGNSCKLIQKMFDDVEYRETFKRTVEREMVRGQARPRRPPQHRAADPARALPDRDRPLAGRASSSRCSNTRQPPGSPCAPSSPRPAAFIEGDLFALGRVYRNLIVNAIQATAPGGLVVVATERARDKSVHVRISDTGCGIPPDRLGQVFEDFVTTKRRGLGLGLAISKKIVEQLGGQISVASEVGKGTTFVLEFREHAAILREQPRQAEDAARAR